ncbi:MAG TPA: PEP-CTERM sorting domain-containing protein [Methylotenera sp.]|jgi:hypothetical protein|nr:PEP-CTERM sorting domain-containing protein [Methylotenera sp.]HPH08898.1 PEP-CTERM sorting domain-containing protein [Methylotenera sp.]HPM48629.1 PEP-CTERM sorting domain-containing protein [Methylotenera sp.]HQM87384.1 PEP-CTERM sorting domain-containing protein [Methylotenera sp.]
MKVRALLTTALVSMSFFWAAAPASAAVYDISVTAAGDVVSHRYWGWFGSGSYSEVGANPNQVYHSYEPGNGNSANTALSFDLASISSVLLADIVSASLNFNILSISTEGRNDVATLSNGLPVLNSNGTGWKSFDVTDNFKGQFGSSPSTASYAFTYTGYSGFTFASAEGGEPAYLRITTIAAVPEPETYAMLLMGLGLIGFMVRRRKFQGNF